MLTRDWPSFDGCWKSRPVKAEGLHLHGPDPAIRVVAHNETELSVHPLLIIHHEAALKRCGLKAAWACRNLRIGKRSSDPRPTADNQNTANRSDAGLRRHWDKGFHLRPWSPD